MINIYHFILQTQSRTHIIYEHLFILAKFFNYKFLFFKNDLHFWLYTAHIPSCGSHPDHGARSPTPLPTSSDFCETARFSSQGPLYNHSNWTNLILSCCIYFKKHENMLSFSTSFQFITCLLMVWWEPSHYMNQCWNIVIGLSGNKLQWNLNWNWYIFNQANAF